MAIDVNGFIISSENLVELRNSIVEALQNNHTTTLEEWDQVYNLEEYPDLPEELKDPGADLLTSELWLHTAAKDGGSVANTLFRETDGTIRALDSLLINNIQSNLQQIFEWIEDNNSSFVDTLEDPYINVFGSGNFVLSVSEFANFITILQKAAGAQELLESFDNLKADLDFIKSLLSEINSFGDVTGWASQEYAEQIGLLSVYTEDPGFFDRLISNTKSAKTKVEVLLGIGAAILGEDSKQKQKVREKAALEIQQEVQEILADNLIFSEQCFMLTNLSHLIKYKKNLPPSFPLPYSSLQVNKNQDLCGVSKAVDSSDKNNPILIQGQPFSFMNKLAVEPTQQALFDIMPHELSSLTPNIRLFKVVTDKNNNEEKEIPITFEISTISPRLEEGLYLSQRGTGVGLKSFKFSYDGTDPFSAKKAISADLSIFASSFNELLRIRNEGQNQYRYTDLALKTARKKMNRL